MSGWSQGETWHENCKVGLELNFALQEFLDDQLPVTVIAEVDHKATLLKCTID